MFIPRSLLASAYAHLKSHAHSTNPSILILCALDIDSLCATRILTHLLKRDYIPHKIHPVSGYQELERLNDALVRDNEDLRFVICLGLGGLVDIATFLELGAAVECWVVDGRRPWNLYNVFVGDGKVNGGRHGVGELGGVKCWDDGDIEEDLRVEGVAFKTLVEMPEGDSDSESEGEEDEGEEEEDASAHSTDEDDGGGALLDAGMLAGTKGNVRKRKSSDEPEDVSDDDGSSRVRRRRRDSNDEESSGASTPLLESYTLLSATTVPTTAMASSPPPARTHSPLSSPSQQLPRRPQPTAKHLRRKLRKLRAQHELKIANYYSQGTWYGEPISGLLYSLASDLGREDNDLLWLAIVGVSSGEIYGHGISSGPPKKSSDMGWVSSREEQIRGVLRDEVRRLNPPEISSAGGFGGSSSSATNNSLQTTARSPDDKAIRMSPEFRFMLIRHWSLYDSMLHSSFLGTKLHIWSEHGRKRLHKLLAKMGFSLNQCKQSYTHMDMDLKRTLRDRLEKYAPLYGLEGVVREGFVRCWGWSGCLSAVDVAYVIGGLLEIGKKGLAAVRLGDGEAIESDAEGRREENRESETWIENFWGAYDALEDIEALKLALPTAMDLHRAILRTGTALIEKRQIRLLRAYRLAVVKEGPDVAIFTHPNAVSKLALWLGDAILEQEREQERKKHLPLVVASLNERRGVYIVVGTIPGGRVSGGAKKNKEKEKEKENDKGKKPAKDGDEEGEEEEEEEKEEEEEEEEEEEDEEEERKRGRNKFGIAFQEVASTTQARIRIDAFEATVVEVRKEDLAGFLEGLSTKIILG